MRRVIGSWLVLSMVGLAVGAQAAPPADLQRYVLVADFDLQIGDGGFVVGDIGVNRSLGTLELDRRVFLADGTAAVGDVTTMNTGTTVFDLFANKATIDLDAGVRNTGPVGFTPPLFGALPALPVFAPGATPVTVEKDGSAMLGPGAYAKLVVKDNGQIELTGGAYQFASVDVGKSAEVLVDAPSTIDVKGNFELGRFTGFGPATSQLGSADVQVRIGGAKVTFGAASHVASEILAPLAEIRFATSMRGRGRFIGSRITTDKTTNIRRPCDASGCDDRAPAPAPTSFCTLDQATYGAADGAANGAAGLVTLHPELFPLTIGGPGSRSLTLAGQGALTCFLPTTGAPATLCSNGNCDGDVVLGTCTVPPLVDFDSTGDGTSGGQGAGALAGQAIAAKLNVALSRLGALSPGLGSLVLPFKLCTTACPEGRELDPISMKKQKVTAGIVDGFTTVSDLLALADQAFVQPCRVGTCERTDKNAFVPPDPIRLSSIATALQAVNECFAGCATIIPCGS